MASVDDLETNTAFANEHEAGFPILADPGKQMSRAYGVLGALGVNNRWTYYIDSNGKVLKIDTRTNPSTAGKDLTRTLEELGFPKK